MGLFNKKKEEKSCCCGSGCTPEKMAQAEAAKTTAGIKVLGAGCAKCHALEDATKAALAELNMDTTIDHVTDFSQIAAYGVMTTPALVVDGKVVSYGKVLNKDEVKALIQKVRGMTYGSKTQGGVYLRPQFLPEPNRRGTRNVSGLRCI